MRRTISLVMLVAGLIILGVSLTSVVTAHFQPTPTPCMVWHNEHWVPCSTPTATPKPTNTPTATPVASPSATPVPYCIDEEPCPTVEPTATPEETPYSASSQNGLSEAGAPELPQCQAPMFAPTVNYLGHDGDTFSYSWTQVEDGLHQYWINWGPTKDNLPYSEVVSGEETTITMYGVHTNWIEVAGYSNGCLGPFSLITN